MSPTPAPVEVAAVDLGASSGRVMVGRVAPDELGLVEAHRFPNDPVDILGTLHWNILGLYQGILDGLGEAARKAPSLASVGVDSWAVDYGVLNDRGRLLSNPVHYRDGRTAGVMEQVLGDVGARRLYETTGLQQLPFNTIYQLVTDATAGALDQADTLLMIPDLLGYWMTGEVGTEATNASTTQLFNVLEHEWAWDLINTLGLPSQIFTRLRNPGEPIGSLLPAVRERTGISDDVTLTAVGSHDTASAVVAVPAQTERFAYVSCGTWSLVGLELDKPVLSEASRLANFTNEGGVDGRIRYLRNVMGLWLLQESIRTWELTGRTIDLSALLSETTELQPLTRVIVPDDPVFLPPGDMPSRIADVCRATDQPVPETPAEFARCILDSLALAYRRTVRQAAELAGQDVDVIHMVGGGVQNALLCQLTADACGLPVVAGPVEATAIGNVLVQGRTLGAIEGDLSLMRSLVARTQNVVHYQPGADITLWDAAERRIS